MAHHPIFSDIWSDHLEAVKLHVLADAAVLEEIGVYDMRPLLFAVFRRRSAIALWLFEHRGQHDVDLHDDVMMTALHWACYNDSILVVQTLVAAGANPTLPDRVQYTPLMYASQKGHSDIVACLLQLPAVRTTIETINRPGLTALSSAS